MSLVPFCVSFPLYWLNICTCYIRKARQDTPDWSFQCPFIDLLHTNLSSPFMTLLITSTTTVVKTKCLFDYSEKMHNRKACFKYIPVQKSQNWEYTIYVNNLVIIWTKAYLQLSCRWWDQLFLFHIFTSLGFEHSPPTMQEL